MPKNSRRTGARSVGLGRAGQRGVRGGGKPGPFGGLGLGTGGGQVGGIRAVRTVAAGARSRAWAAWAAEWVIDRVRAAEQGAGERDVAGAALVREDVVADDGGARRADGGQAMSREVRGRWSGVR